MTVEELPGQDVETYDVFLSFTRASPGSADQAERLEKTLSARGLRVFRDVLIGEFTGITGELVDALAGSRALVAYPIELADAKFAGDASTDAELARLVTVIAARVATLTGPLGTRPGDHNRLPAAVLAARRFVGRYAEMWHVMAQLVLCGGMVPARPG